MQPLIRVQGLRHTYSLDDGTEITALQDVDLAIEPGEFVALIGQNGSGKSTLAHHLNGLLLPSAGEVWINGMLTSDPHHKWAVRQTVGMVFQNPDNQLVASTVEEDVAFGPENRGCPSDQIRKQVDAALRIVGLTDYAAHPPHMLSGGQRQLVAIAGALAAEAECIVFDEPTSMLDPLGRKQVLVTIQRLNAEKGITVVLITQSMDEAAIARRLIVMHAGRIVMEGPPEEIFEHQDELRTLGLGLPPAVEIAHRLRKMEIDLPPGLLTVEALARALC